MLSGWQNEFLEVHFLISYNSVMFHCQNYFTVIIEPNFFFVILFQTYKAYLKPYLNINHYSITQKTSLNLSCFRYSVNGCDDWWTGMNGIIPWQVKRVVQQGFIGIIPSYRSTEAALILFVHWTSSVFIYCHFVKKKKVLRISLQRRGFNCSLLSYTVFSSWPAECFQ